MSAHRALLGGVALGLAAAVLSIGTAAIATEAPIAKTVLTSRPSSLAGTLPSGSVHAGLPAFSWSEAPVDATELGKTWHVGCPVAPSALRLLTMRYVGFDGRAHTGTMVVNASVVHSVITVFSTLYAERFPIKEMIPEASYAGNDNAAAAADDTSGFNCRYAVAPGPPKWSVHAYGEAIDVNDVQNPYFDGSIAIPPSGIAYRDRAEVRPGMAVLGGALVGAFASVGWPWGGRWTGSPDYQHFSLTGG